MKIDFKSIFKNRSPVFYVFLAWIVSTILIVYFVFPLVSANVDYFLGQKKDTNTQPINDSKPQATVKKDPALKENKLIVSKINVDAPIVEAASIKDSDILGAMENGIAHYPVTSKPGEVGNAFFVGHSSNYRWAKGNYNFIFANLNKLAKGDLIIVNFNQVKYVYKVFDVVVVPPEDVSVLGQTKDSIISLMTCDPPGTTWKRRVVKAIQIEPDPKTNTALTTENPVPVNSLVGN